MRAFDGERNAGELTWMTDPPGDSVIQLFAGEDAVSVDHRFAIGSQPSRFVTPRNIRSKVDDRLRPGLRHQIGNPAFTGE
jgi:hypothetical protein